MVVIHDSHSGVCNRVNAGSEVVFQKFEITAVNINENRWTVGGVSSIFHRARQNGSV
jgi:hypothetical protein